MGDSAIAIDSRLRKGELKRSVSVALITESISFGRPYASLRRARQPLNRIEKFHFALPASKEDRGQHWLLNLIRRRRCLRRGLNWTWHWSRRCDFGLFGLSGQIGLAGLNNQRSRLWRRSDNRRSRLRPIFQWWLALRGRWRNLHRTLSAGDWYARYQKGEEQSQQVRDGAACRRFHLRIFNYDSLLESSRARSMPVIVTTGR